MPQCEAAVSEKEIEKEVYTPKKPSADETTPTTSENTQSGQLTSKMRMLRNLKLEAEAKKEEAVDGEKQREVSSEYDISAEEKGMEDNI